MRENILKAAEIVTAVSSVIAVVVAFYWSFTLDATMPSSYELINFLWRGVLAIITSLLIFLITGGVFEIIESTRKKEMS